MTRPRRRGAEKVGRREIVTEPDSTVAGKNADRKAKKEGLKAMADLNEIAETLSGLTVMEAAELATLLEEKWGVSAAAPVAVAAVAGGAAGGEAAAAEQTEFDVVLTSFGDKKIQVIKVVREITALGLKEAKALVEEAPKPIKEGVEKEEAESIKKKIEEAGGQADLK